MRIFCIIMVAGALHAQDCTSFCPQFIRGDVNFDGQVNITDCQVFGTLYYGPGVPYDDVYDVNDDGQINANDLLHLCSGSPIPPPNDWGFDSSIDNIDPWCDGIWGTQTLSPNNVLWGDANGVDVNSSIWDSLIKPSFLVLPAYPFHAAKVKYVNENDCSCDHAESISSWTTRWGIVNAPQMTLRQLDNGVVKVDMDIWVGEGYAASTCGTQFSNCVPSCLENPACFGVNELRVEYDNASIVFELQDSNGSTYWAYIPIANNPHLFRYSSLPGIAGLCCKQEWDNSQQIVIFGTLAGWDIAEEISDSLCILGDLPSYIGTDRIPPEDVYLRITEVKLINLIYRFVRNASNDVMEYETIYPYAVVDPLTGDYTLDSDYSTWLRRLDIRTGP